MKSSCLLVWFHVFIHENESRKAAKRKGSWAHQQTDKITPWIIVFLSAVEDLKMLENQIPSCERTGVSISYKVALREGWTIFLEALKPAAACLTRSISTLFVLRLLEGSTGDAPTKKKMQSMDCMSQFQNIVLRVADQPLNQTRKMAMTTAGCECFEMCSRHRKALWQAMVWFHFCRRGVFMFDGQIPTVHGKTNCYRSPSHQAFSCVSIFSIQLKPQVLMVRSQFKTHFSICFPMFFLSSVSSLVGLEMSGVCQPRPSRDGGLNTGIRGITTWQLTHISLPSK